MPQPTDDPNAKILPDPELNPLLNPLLAAHMGRWAEVYFTSSPEKRAEAVSELVRELANNSTPPEIAAQATTGESTHETPHESADETVEELPEEAVAHELPVQEAALICEKCGQRNSARQRFCGMCGEYLSVAAEFNPPQISEAAPAAPRWDAPEPIPAGESSDGDSDPAPHFVYRREDFFGPGRPASLPVEERPTEFASLAQYEPESPSHGYRVYVGAMVAIILALLVYATWRNNTKFWSSGNAPAALPQAVPAPSNESRPATASTPARTVPTRGSSTKRAEPATSSAAPAPSNQETTNESVQDGHGIKAAAPPPAPAPRIVPVSVSSSAGTAEQNGSEELATAEKYLNASPGRARDSQEAASWLWKAVAKKNLTATLLLSDLYLRGDGVTKSCDQARLLLDAAARKGGTAAAERLRNLSAFGCQ